MKKIFFLIVAFAICYITNGQQIWPQVNSSAKPLTRWWWMGNAVDGKNIQHLLNEYNRVGIGGVEIVPIYGTKGFEHRYINYLSPHWMKILDTTVATAKKYNMSVDVSIGSGWPIGGPDVSLKDAATKMEVVTFKLSAGEKYIQKILLPKAKSEKDKQVAPETVMAYSPDGDVVDVKKFLNQEGFLNWAPQKSEYTVIALFNAKTGQKVKRAAPGGEGYTLDHFSSESVSNYIKYFDRHFGNTSHGVRSLYNDSYEVFNADWSPDFFAEFQKRRGYDLKQYLPQLIADKVTDELTGRVKSDYRETMSDLILNNFTKRLTSWAHSKNAVFLNQAHGSPGNLLDLYAAVDIPETETFGSSVYSIEGLRRDMYDPRIADTEPLMFKFASSAAHIAGHNFTSSETHTWLTEHFKTNLALCKPEAENLFLSGVNQLMFHGTTYSPADAPWPGWLFYASVDFTPANSLWNHLKGYNDYITRCQSVLQAGKPDNEILLYWPVYDLWQQTDGMDLPFRAHNTDVWIHGTDLNEKSKRLKNNGYSFDYVSDDMIQKASVRNKKIYINTGGADYSTIICPAFKTMPVKTFENLIQLAKSGATVIMNNLPIDVPGLNQLEERRIILKKIVGNVQKNLKNGIAAIGAGQIIISEDVIKTLQLQQLYGEQLVQTGLQFIRRKVPDGWFYYIVNHTAGNIDSLITLNKYGANLILLDPQTGNYGKPQITAASSQNKIRLQLESGESMIIRLTNKKTMKADNWKYNDGTKTVIPLQKNWSLIFKTGGPVIPPAKNINTLKLWSDFKDSVYTNFSGTAMYSTTVNLKKNEANEYLLQLGELYETAQIRVNGKFVGYIYSIPYQLRIGKYLKQGVNKIEIEVSNLMANRIRYMDRNGMSWRNYHEINFVNKDYKEFNAAQWSVMPSGLAGPVNIIVF
ncbi:MAG: glycosyl hydrolase [Niabella sp.]